MAAVAYYDDRVALLAQVARRALRLPDERARRVDYLKALRRKLSNDRRAYAVRRYYDRAIFYPGRTLDRFKAFLRKIPYYLPVMDKRTERIYRLFAAYRFFGNINGSLDPETKPDPVGKN